MVENFVFFVIFDTYNVVYNWSIAIATRTYCT